jgi:hypothetical protein
MRHAAMAPCGAAPDLARSLDRPLKVWLAGIQAPRNGAKISSHAPGVASSHVVTRRIEVRARTAHGDSLLSWACDFAHPDDVCMAERLLGAGASSCLLLLRGRVLPKDLPTASTWKS